MSVPVPDVPAVPPRLDSYWRDILIGVSVAATVHLGALFGFNGHAPEAQTADVVPDDVVLRLEMPVLEPPDEVEVVEMTDAPASPQLAAPTLMDLPSTVAVSSFVQPLRPTIDPTLTSVGAFTIPSNVGNFGAQGAVRLFELRELDRVPRRVRTVMPVYPHELRRAAITGEVVLMVIIDPSGHVEVERVISATHREFEDAAVKAAEQCMFEPPLRVGQKVSARYRWHIPFDLK